MSANENRPSAGNTWAAGYKAKQAKQSIKPKPKKRKATAAQLAIRSLARPMKDRERQLLIYADTLLLVDDGGAEQICSFDDFTACHYFLVWLREERQRIAERRMKAALEAEHRAKFRLVGGGK